MNQVHNIFWTYSLTFIKAVVIHVSVHVQVLPGHQGELRLGMLVGPIVGVVTVMKE